MCLLPKGFDMVLKWRRPAWPARPSFSVTGKPSAGIAPQFASLSLGALFKRGEGRRAPDEARAWRDVAWRRVAWYGE